MDIKKVVVTGDAIFLDRYRNLFIAISDNCEQLDYLPYSLNEAKLSNFLKKVLPTSLIPKANKLFRKNRKTFISKSQQMESRIRQLEYTPDLVIHLFGMYSPFADKFDIPYVMYLDYTMALAAKNWSPWAPFNNPQELELWLACEHQAYERCHHIFPMSNVVKTSLIEDYGIAPEKITVVGASGNFTEAYQGEKTFGSKQILFNGSDFERKGGDLVLAAFKKVKQALPDAKLVIIGKKIAIAEDGIENPGHIASPSQLRDLFLKTDLVVAPAYCDPFPVFLMDAMNYGVPCSVSAKDGMPEIVEHKVNGIVIPDLKAEIIADNIIHLLSNISVLKSMSERAREQMKIKLNWDNIAKNILQILSKA